MTPLPGQPRTIGGIRYYITDTGRQIIADTWDAIFLPAHGIAMRKDKKHKGSNPDKRQRWTRDEKSY